MLTVPQSVIYCSVISNSIILKYLLYLILTIIIAIIRHTDIKATIAIPILFNTLSIHPSPCLYNIFFIHLHITTSATTIIINSITKPAAQSLYNIAIFEAAIRLPYLPKRFDTIKSI